MSWGPLLVNLAVTAGLVAVLMLGTFGYAMRTRVMWFVSLPVQAAMYEHASVGLVSWLGGFIPWPPR
jgi:hypothetical protein